MNARTMRSSMAAAVVSAVLTGFFGCSTDDPSRVDAACEVIFQQCQMGRSMGDCIDEMGGQTIFCLDCVIETGCEYPAECQLGIDGCRLSPALGGSRAAADGGSSRGSRSDAGPSADGGG